MKRRQMEKKVVIEKNIIREEKAEISEKKAIVGGAPIEKTMIRKFTIASLGDKELIPLFITMFRVKQRK
jgi:hypothetical protein